MSFCPPPLADDVEGDFGEYNVDEIITARACLIHTVQKETAMAWHGLKYKMGILPNGQRLRVHDSPHMWIPDPLPTLWSAPVALYDPVSGKIVDGADDSERPEESCEHFQVMVSSDDGQREVRKEKGKTLSSASSSSSRMSDASSEKLGSVVDHALSSPTSSSSKQPGLSSDAISRSSQQAERRVDASPKASQSSGQKRRQGDSEKDSAATTTASSKRQKIHPESASAISATTAAVVGKDSACASPQETGEQAEDYEIMYQCDICSFCSKSVKRMKKHMKGPGHISASQYLCVSQSGDLVPKYLFQMCALKEPKSTISMFATCPICNAAFRDMAQCVSHSQSAHGEHGVYSFRNVSKSVNLVLEQESNTCTECGEHYKDSDFRAHMKKTNHMYKYDGKQTAKKMVLHLCPFCPAIISNYFKYKAHVFETHKNEVEQAERVEGTAYTVSKHHMTRLILPQDPGIPLEKIKGLSSSIPTKRQTTTSSASATATEFKRDAAKFQAKMLSLSQDKPMTPWMDPDTERKRDRRGQRSAIRIRKRIHLIKKRKREKKLQQC